MPGFNNGVVWADNVRFDGTAYPGEVTTDGQLLIGSTVAPNIRVGTLASADSTVTITPGAGTIDLSASSMATTYDGNTGAATPSGGVLHVVGNTPGLSTSASGNTVSIFTIPNYVDGYYQTTFVGNRAGNSSVNLSQTTIVGDSAAPGIQAGGDYNTFLGANCAHNLTTGNANVAIGSDCCYTSNGSNNTVVGVGAGSGVASTSEQNSILGFWALRSSTTGGGNSGIGYKAGENISTGVYNDFFGGQSLQNLTTGNYNISIGSFSGSSYIGAEDSNIVIANPGVAGESNNIHIGTTGTHTACTIAGIASVATSNSEMVTIDTTTGQLGSQAIQGVTTWTAVGASGTLAVNNGYICTGGAALAFSLPATAAVGTQIGIVLAGSTSWSITQGVGQSITIAPTTTTPGVGGSVTSLTAGTSLTLICTAANTHWTAIASTGTFTIV